MRTKIVRYGISKYLKEHCSVDISNDVQFAGSKDVFKAVVVDLKKKRYASTDHKPPISKEDLQKLYNTNSIAINTTTPFGLQKKVWFDIMFYLCRRGQENLRSMTKKNICFSTDSSGREYVYQQVDEYDKNHRDEATPDDSVVEARMYARVGDPLCPVFSFKLYLEKLHPALDELWQRTKDSYDISDTTWYCKALIGKTV
ncbi:KCTD1_15 [Mytilus coruscus]|uniref:KCTD1_15 n=1 Tax=Mytilus coruscus TaxID=42192 RepID=A0A6J8CVC9_MYTCO|nr:KCTD1_15 [Mytilus coruscus]